MKTEKKPHTFCLVTSCPDAVGIVAAVSQFVADSCGSLIESNHHTDTDDGWFYMRNVITVDPLSVDIEEFRKGFATLANQFDMKWHVRDVQMKQKVVMLASHSSHCLADLLHRWHSGELYCDIPCVISNHENLRSMVEWHGIPFHYVPVPKENKQAAFDKMSDIIDRHNADTIVLARYMQIFPPELCAKFEGRLINIHHSFLPSFIGGNPYRKAYDWCH